MSRYRTGLLVLLALALLFALAVGTLVTTPTGTRLVLDALGTLGGWRFTYAASSGTLAGALQLRDVRYEDARLRLEVDTLDLRWAPRALFGGRLTITRLTLGELRYRVRETAPSTVAPALEYPLPPLALSVRTFHIAALVDARDGTVLARQLSGALRWRRDALQIERFTLTHDAATLRGSATLAATTPPTLHADVAWRGSLRDRVIAGGLRADGPLSALAFDGRMQAPLAVTTRGTADLLARPVRLSLQATLAEYVAADGLRFSATQAALSGTPVAVHVELDSVFHWREHAARAITLSGEITRDDAALAAQFSWDAPAGDDGSPAWRGQGTARQEATRYIVSATSAAPWAARLDASLTRDLATPLLDAELSWSDLSVAQPGLQALAGGLQVHGPLQALTLRGAASAQSTRLGPLAATWQGRLTPAALELTTSATLLDGQIDASGSVQRGDKPNAQFSFAARALDLVHLHHDLPSRIDARGTLDVATEANGLASTLTLEALSGRWREHDVSAHGRARHAGSTYAIETLEAALGDNRLSVSGTLGEQLDARYTAEMPRLDQLAGALGGSLAASGTLAGTRRAPSLRARIDARALRIGAWSLARAAGAATLDFSSAAPASLRLAIDHLAYAERRLGSGALALSGERAQHALSFTLAGPDQALDLRADARWDEGTWEARLHTLALTLPELGAWSLADSALLTAGPAGVNLTPLCLHADSARACAEVGGWSAHGGQAALELLAVPIALTRRVEGSAIDLALAGQLDATVTASRDANGTVGQGTARLREGTLTLSGRDGAHEEHDLTHASADADLTAAHVDVRAALMLGHQLTLHGDVRVARDDEQTLSGLVAAGAADLDWLNRLVPALGGSAGSADLVLNLAGTRAAPRVSGRLRLIDGALRVPQSGLALDALTLDLAPAADGDIALTLAAQSGGQALRGNGLLRLDAAAGWPLTLALDGERIPLVRLPDVEADVSPDITLRQAHGLLDLEGTLTLDRVDINLRALPASAVAVSEDEVLVGVAAGDGAHTGEAPQAFFAAQLAADVMLMLGPDITLDAAGLDARVAGDLRWTKRRGDSRGRGAGRISVVDGAYQAYGQALDIEHGHLTFAGPIDNPGLDVQATRPDLEVTAGVRVSGNLRSPQFTLFSQPPMTDSEILSWLVTGHSLTDASSGEASLIAQAALSLGAERSSMVTNQIQNAFRLDEFSVNAGANVNQTSFTAGKRLTPKLTVRSEFNPFERLWSFFLNYKLNKVWSIEAETGQRQGADVLYTIESDTLIPPGVFGTPRPSEAPVPTTGTAP